MLRADKMFSRETMDAARNVVSSLSFDLDPDSVDQLPTFEVQWMYDGKYTNKELESIFKEPVRSAQRATTLGLVFPSSSNPAPNPERVSF
jgi:hypothetical protein